MSDPDYKITRFFDTNATDLKMTERWRIVTTAPYSPPRVLALPAIPKLNTFFVDPTTNVTSTKWKVTNREVEFINNDNRIWEVSIEYSDVGYLEPRKPKDTTTPPWQQKSVVTLSSRVTKMKAMHMAYLRAEVTSLGYWTFYDKNDDPVLTVPTSGLPTVPVRNSAGDVYSPVPEVEEGGVVLEITTSIQDPLAVDVLTYSFTLNSEPVTFGPWAIPPFQGKLESISVSPSEWAKQQENGSVDIIEYWVVKYVVSVDQFPQFARIPDMGYNMLVTVPSGGGTKQSKIPIKMGNGQRPSTPEFLDGEGGWPGIDSPLSTDPVMRYYLGHRVQDWNELPYRD